MITVEKLNAFGADTAEGLARCCGMEQLYLKLVNMVPDDSNFDALQTALENNDPAAGFAAAHALKGMLGNLSLTPLYEKVSEITELLRAQNQENCAPLLRDILAMRGELLAMRDE